MKHLILAIAFLFIMAVQAQAVEYNFQWTAPTVNDDGTQLDDLAGYYLYEDGVKKKDVGNVTSHIYNVPEGSHTYTVRAYDTSGNESTDSPSRIFDITICPAPPPTLDATKVVD